MIELYSLPGCPYCGMVKRTLDNLDLQYIEHHVPAARPMRSEVKDISGQSGVPVIVDTENGVKGMAESSKIISYLEETYG